MVPPVYVVAVAMGVLNVDGVAGFAANDYGGTVFVLLVDESALNAGLARGAPESRIHDHVAGRVRL